MTTDISGTTFGGWLKQRRKELGIRPDEFAERIGCSTITLLKIESGERRPSRQMAELLAEHLRVPIDEIESFVTFARLGYASESGTESEVAARAPWRTAHLYRTNLPSVLTDLIGRAQEEEEARNILLQPRVRLLTLTGAPGIGKTRLALQVAASMIGSFEDGVFLVELAPVSDPDLVPASIARTLGLQENSGQSIEDALLGYLRERRTLLLMDNFEHLLDAAPTLVKLLEGSPWLKVLATSREALHVRGERRYAVAPLRLPELRKLPPLELLATYPSVELFVERARAATARFNLTKANGADLAAVCVGLEGLPLALELAAARVADLSLREMRASLNSRLKLLTAGSRDLPARQRTLRNAIEWSYDLLDEYERKLLRRLAVFMGGFTPEAVREVCSDEPVEAGSPLAIQERLAALADKNLVRRDENAIETRYGMLETVREYAGEQLLICGEAEATRQKHSIYYAQLVVTANMKEGEAERTVWMDRLEVENDNLREAMKVLLIRGRGEAKATEQVMSMAQNLYHFWNARGYFTEGREWLDKCRINAEQVPAEARDVPFKSAWLKALNGAGLLAWNQGDHENARNLFEQSRVLAQELGNKRALVIVANNMGLVASEQGDFEAARSLYKESLAQALEIDYRPMAALALNNLGVVSWDTGDIDNALSYYEQALTLFRELNEQANIIMVLDNLGIVATQQQDFAAARRYQEECLAWCRQSGHRNNLVHVLANMGGRAVDEGNYQEARELFMESLLLVQEFGYKKVAVTCIEGIASIWLEEDRVEGAARLWGAEAALRDIAGMPVPVPGLQQHDMRVARTRERLGPSVFDRERAAGHAMSMEEVFAYILEAES